MRVVETSCSSSTVLLLGGNASRFPEGSGDFGLPWLAFGASSTVLLDADLNANLRLGA